MDSERVDQDLRVVLRELRTLPEYAEDWDPERVNDDLDAYASYWASVACDRMDELEHAFRSGTMSPEQERRYSEVKAIFWERLPLIERYGLEGPGYCWKTRGSVGGCRRGCERRTRTATSGRFSRNSGFFPSTPRTGTRRSLPTNRTFTPRSGPPSRTTG